MLSARVRLSLAEDISRESPRGFSKTPANSCRSLSTHFDTPHIFRVSAYADEQKSSRFFESSRSRRRFFAAHRESLAARRRSASHVPESTWGFYEVGTAFSRPARPLRESACAFCRSAGISSGRPPHYADRRLRTGCRRARAVIEDHSFR